MLRRIAPMLVVVSILTPAAEASTPPAFLWTWGTQGAGPGQFNDPRDIAISADGFVYVVDTINHRVQKFTADGDFVAQWGGYGESLGRFAWPQGLAIDAQGRVYVADTFNHRIQRFDENGTPLGAFGNDASGPGSLSYPRGVAVSAEGWVFVADTYAHRIVRFTSGGDFAATWGGPGTGDGQFTYPYSISVGESRYLYVADSEGNRIQKFSPNGSFVLAWGAAGSGEGEFDRPMDAAVDPREPGLVYVPDRFNHRVQIFGPFGNYLGSFGARGAGIGEFYNPAGAAVDSAGRVYVVDGGNARIQVFGELLVPDGEILSISGATGLPGSVPLDLDVHLENVRAARGLEFRVVDQPDRLRVVDVQPAGRARDMIVSFSDEGDLHCLFYSPSGGSIAPGVGPIARLAVAVSPGAVLGDSIELHLRDVKFAGPSNEPIPVALVPGIFRVGYRPGDVNGDNRVDVADVVRFVEVVLGTGSPATPEEREAGDCVDDGTADIFDVNCLVDRALDSLLVAGASGPGEEPGPVVTDLLAESEILGLQYWTRRPDASPERLGALRVRYRAGVSEGPVVAFDPQAEGVSPGSRMPLPEGTRFADLRAFGPGGAPLAVVLEGTLVRIGTPAPGPARALVASPNPFRSETTLRFRLDREESLVISIHDARGRVVRAFPARVHPAGPNAVIWDRTDDAGRPVAAGFYIAAVRGAGFRASERVLVLND